MNGKGYISHMIKKSAYHGESWPLLFGMDLNGCGEERRTPGLLF